MSRGVLILLVALQGGLLLTLFVLLAWNHLTRTALARRRRRYAERLSLALLRWERGRIGPERLEAALDGCPPGALFEVLERHFEQLDAGRARGLVDRMRASDRLRKARSLARSPFWWRRQRGAELLGYMGRGDDAALLSELLADDHPAVASAALLAARRLRLPELLGPLLDELEAESPPGHRRFLVDVLMGYGPRLVRALADRLESGGPPEAQVARLELAGRLGHPELAGPVLRRAREGTLEVRINAVRALASFPMEEALEPLRSALRDPAWEVRVQAASAFGRLGEEAAVPDLRQALGDPSWWVRLRAALALRKIGEDGLSVLEAFREGGGEDDRYAADMARYVLSLDPEALQEHSR